MDTKTKIKTTIKIILATALVIALMAIYENHKDQRRADYAAANGCSWTIQGSHDICKQCGIIVVAY